ncbi:MAG TPA: metallophosphoesterase [Polyangiaceae bacterium]|jgi:predicted MPP superfamily phosphohydrolase|nr:metallophosphoesterase [Polyangiaceae bacterium]
MPRLLTFALFFTIMVTLVGGAHYYVWSRLVRDPALPLPATRALTYALVFLFVAIPGTLFLRRSSFAGLTEPLVWLAMTWLGLLLFLVLALGVADLGRGIWELARSLSDAPPLDPGRRQAAARIVAGAAALVGATLGSWSVRSALGQVRLRRVEVPLARLPKTLSGTRIVQLSDVHVGPTIHKSFIETIVARTNALNPDIIAITGDLVDGSVADLAEHVAPLAKLRAKYGVFFVTGNHEYYSGAEEWCAELRRLGIVVLRNERVSIGEGAASFDLAGTDDHSARRFGGGHGEDLPKALRGRDPARELVLLAHQPKTILEAQDHGVGLQLSGHTHGGQIWPWTYLVRLQQPVVAGLARFGQSLVYVSSGTGYWGPPMRLGAPAEITELVLLST